MASTWLCMARCRRRTERRRMGMAPHDNPGGSGPVRLGARPARRTLARFASGMPALAAIVLIGASARLWALNSVGVNSDEAVYAGPASAIADEPAPKPP